MYLTDTITRSLKKTGNFLEPTKNWPPGVIYHKLLKTFTRSYQLGAEPETKLSHVFPENKGTRIRQRYHKAKQK